MKKHVFSLVLFLLSIAGFAQTNDPVVMKVNGKDVRKSEFEYIYHKNNSEDAIDKRSFDEYITLFKNFKLKVAEAESQGIDTTAAFKKELKEYRAQLAKPYLSKLAMNEDVLRQTYLRNQELVEVSVLFVAFPSFGKGNFTLVPADTAATYNQAMEIRNKALQQDAVFEDLVQEYSSDERTKQNSRPGYLGWFSAMDLLPMLEEPIYNTPVGGISRPIRTNQGYYLIKILQKIQNPGEVNAAHILIRTPQTMDTLQTEVKDKIAEIYKRLSEGALFEDLAKEYSDDKVSAEKGGDLSWFSYGQMVPEFNNAVFSMKEIGSISQPIHTQFGYHIIKLLGKRPVASFDELRKQIENKMERTGNFMVLYQTGIDQLKAEFHYSPNEKTYNLLSEAAKTAFPTDSLFTTPFENNQETLFTVGNENVSVADFIAYLKSEPKTYTNLSTDAFAEKFNQFVYNNLINAEEKNLEDKFPDFRNLMQEYHDGILLFEVSNKEIWDKASADTAGLIRFFEKNKMNYAWDEPHWKGYVVLFKDAKLKKSVQKEIEKMPYEQAASYVIEKYAESETSPVSIEKGLFTKGQNSYVDEVIFNGPKTNLPDGFADFLLVGTLMEKLPESYTDVRGLVITDYQDYLEEEWLKELNAKYPVEIYETIRQVN
ncbi:MAG: peptidylprolyl isomerase [Candidatus Azobacteroides sp.]|nr:peptidylprolyl isomerase [Candidatus Azobacteroides sp.]